MLTDLFPLLDFVSMFADSEPRPTRFEYCPARDERLRPKAARTEWERYYAKRLLGERASAGGALVVESVGLCGDFLSPGEVLPLAGGPEVFHREVGIRPGFYHYQFVLHPGGPDEAVVLDDPLANGDLCAPDLARPGLKRSGLVVYPSAAQSSAGPLAIEACRGKVIALDDHWVVKVAVPAAQVRWVAVRDGGQARRLAEVARVDGICYLRGTVTGGPPRSVALEDESGAHLELTFTAGAHLASRREGSSPACPAPLPDPTPAWSKRAVWYTLLPDRFRHASPDPARAERSRATWTRDYHDLLPGERSYYPDVYFRRYDGTLSGIAEKLGYLRELGVNALCLTPVFMGGAYHKYDTIDLRHVDPDFGPSPEADRRLLAEARETEDPSTWILTEADREFIALVRAVHAAGMRIIVDGVFSHVGDRFWAFQDVVRRGRESPYWDWFWFREGASGKPGEPPEYECFFGMGHLPKLRFDADGLVGGVRRHVFDVVQRWMTPFGAGSQDSGVDGWRLDVANELPLPFWRAFRAHVKALNPEAFILGEMLGTAYERYLDGQSLDAIINYRFGALAVRYFVNERDPVSSAELAEALRRSQATYQDGCAYAQQNALDSHDLDRIVSRIQNRDRPYGTQNKIQYAHHGYDASKPNPAAYRILRSLIAFQVVSVGAPHLLYGTEAGMWGATDPHCRKPMLWDDLGEYETEWCTYPAHQGRHFSMDVPRFDYELRREIAGLLALRNQHPELAVGDTAVLTPVAGEGIAILRHHRGRWFLAAFNRSPRPEALRFHVEDVERHGLSFASARVVGRPAAFDRSGPFFSLEVDRKGYALIAGGVSSW